MEKMKYYRLEIVNTFLFIANLNQNEHTIFYVGY